MLLLLTDWATAVVPPRIIVLLIIGYPVKNTGTVQRTRSLTHRRGVDKFPTDFLENKAKGGGVMCDVCDTRAHTTK